MTEILQTDRLIVRTFAKNDFRNFLSLNQDKELMQYFDEGVKSLEKLRMRFNEIIEHQSKYDFSYYNFFLKDTNEYVGQGGCYYNFDMSINVCYGFLKKFHGQGYASEAVGNVLKYEFSKRNFKEVVIRSAKENIASIKLAERLGGVKFKEAKTLRGMEVVYFKIEKEILLKKYDK
ncbi:MAG: GNAT family N-acetyltransferase [Rickettsiales bacterium]|jgi:RimJ/RimL family protein N-acetyltransferase|nr:GNAT family N-acetyltransferase [Rickettsiales bacterium]